VTALPREILIRVDAAGVASWDASIRDGSWRPPGRAKFPLVLGTDGAGTVVAKGSRVRRFAVGDRVYAYAFGNPKGGFYAEYVAVKAEDAARVPAQLDSLQAGSGRPYRRRLPYDMDASPQWFKRLERSIASKRFHVPIAAVYPLARAAKAHERLAQGHVVGSIVLRVRRASPSAT
jgi:NADPH:quinone reductase-like Zn-dependent oxidoreductase